MKEKKEKNIIESVEDSSTEDINKDFGLDRDLYLDDDVDLRNEIDSISNPTIEVEKPKVNSAFAHRDKVKVKKNTYARYSGVNRNPVMCVNPAMSLTITQLNVPKSTLKPEELKHLSDKAIEPLCVLCDIPNWEYGVYVDYSNLVKV